MPAAAGKAATGKKTSLRPPLTLSSLDKLVSTVSALGWPFYIKKLLISMLLLSFHGFLRPGEMTDSPNAILFQNVEVTHSKVKLTLFCWKHSKGTPVCIKIKRQFSRLCPVAALIKFLLVRGLHKGNLFCHSDGSPVLYSWYRQRFNALIKIARLDSNLKPHSARIGAATHAAAIGVSEELIKRWGRWASGAYKAYIKLPSLSLF